MAPVAQVVHRARGRLRLRVPGRRHDEGFFAGLSGRLAVLPGVIGVSANPATAGLLLLLDPASDHDPVSAIAAAGLLEVVEQGPVLSPALSGLRRASDRLDLGLAEATGGIADLRTLTFVLLLALALHQAARGQLLVPAASLLWYAFDLIRFARPTDLDPHLRQP